MKWTLRTGISSLLLAGALCTGAAAQDTEKVLVGRVIDIDGPRLYASRLTPNSWFQAYQGMVTFLRERLQTDKDTQAAVSFIVGGRAGIGRNTKVEIISRKDIETVKAAPTLKIDAGTFWAKFEKQEEEFQIQTSGGVIGIEGTELLIGVEEETGVTEVLLFEGQVTVTDTKGNEKTMFPGDYAEFGGPKSLCVLSYPAPALRTLVVERFPKFSSFLAGQNITSIPRPASPTLIRGFNASRDGLLTVLTDAQSLGATGVSGLSSSSDSGPPTFRWSPVPGANEYALYVTGDEALQDVRFSSRVDTTTFTVPSGAEGLESGQYYWTVVPLDDKGKPLAQPQTASFQTPGWTSEGVLLEGEA